ncbi:MAG TPA: hypothetical protein VM802_10075 [Chitinophaga sp.]|uniref:hypothetical protein n=1 Tax=Chitinophaga sp. TaxID=1869181 RepID=UPI002CFB4BE3|nr:hypothetical protein [Chitinophaga sp.]HVI45209.1 hypothetical protein [Chitinophaga sp.]
MKQYFTFMLTLFIWNNSLAEKFSFKLTNTTPQQLQVYTQLFKNVEKAPPEFLFTINPNEVKRFYYKIRKGEQLKIIANSNGLETLPLVKSHDRLSSKSENDLQLVLPVLDKINIVDLSEEIMKLKNDNVWKFLMDSTQYSQDNLPPLGTFLFVNLKNNHVMHLLPLTWRNQDNIRRTNVQCYNTTNIVNCNNAAQLRASGIPFLQSLSTSFEKSNILELIYDIQNAHIEQWQASSENVIDILIDPRNSDFICSCIDVIKENSLGGGDYQLLFISSAYVVDRIKISARKYNMVQFNADVDFQLPSSSVEVVQPIGINADYRYLREKTYSSVDSSVNEVLKLLSQDYTPSLNMYLNQQEKRQQREAADLKINNLKLVLNNQYSALCSLDSTLIWSNSMDIIIPIVITTTEAKLKSEIIDSTGKNITPQSDLDFNRKMNQYNAILHSIKENIVVYQATLESINKLGQNNPRQQPTNNLTIPIVVDEKVIKTYQTSR